MVTAQELMNLFSNFFDEKRTELENLTNVSQENKLLLSALIDEKEKETMVMVARKYIEDGIAHILSTQE
jgi:hypothetical protein